MAKYSYTTTDEEEKYLTDIVSKEKEKDSSIDNEKMFTRLIQTYLGQYTKTFYGNDLATLEIDKKWKDLSQKDRDDVRAIVTKVVVPVVPKQSLLSKALGVITKPFGG